MKETEMMSIPHLFRCPISLDLFNDPVTLCTGQTYDRANIEKWLAAGNLTCPVTMQKLHDPTIVPNHTLRHLIHQWLRSGSIFDPQYLETFESLASLKRDLESNEDGFLQNKQRSLEKLLAQLPESSDSCFPQLGFLPLLLSLVFGESKTNFSEEYLIFIELALSCVLRLLALGESEPLNMLKEEPKNESFVGLMENGTSTIRKSLCQMLEAISSSLVTKELCATLGGNRRLLREVVLVIQSSSEASDAGIKAISALCSSQSIRANLIEEGATRGLITYILNAENQDRSYAPLAVATIEQLLEDERAKEEIVSCSDGINVLVKMVFRVSEHEGSESAVNALIAICSNSTRAREEALMAGVLTQLLLLLQSQSSGRAKDKARMLLKMLRSK